MKFNMSSFECARCLQCCQRYFITLLPQEAFAQAKFLKMPLPSFLHQYATLLVQVIPSKETSHPFVFARNELPFETQLPKNPDFDFVFLIPGIALQRKGTACTFLDTEKKSCNIHPVRPGQCALFPLISRSKSFVTKSDYPFCVGLQTADGIINQADNEKQYSRVKKHLDLIQSEGFDSVWNQKPNKGVIILEEKVISELDVEWFEEVFS